MKHLKYLLIGLIATLFCRCTKFQYITLTSDLKKNAKDEFILENDTLLLKYQFKGEGGPVSIYAYNKLQKPLFIDWAMSAIILDGRSYSFFSNESDLNATLNGSSYQLTKRYSTVGANVRGTIKTYPDKTFIPPQTFIEESKITVKNAYVPTPSPLTQTIKIKDIANLDTNGKFQTYNQSNTPLRFKSYLTFSFSEDSSHTFHIESNFWAEQITEILLNPDNRLIKPNNQFYVRRNFN